MFTFAKNNFIMNKLKLFLLLILGSLLFLGCEEEEENSIPDILGTWEMTAYTLTNAQTIFSNDTEALSYSQIGSDFSYQYRFNNNTVNSEGSYMVTTIFDNDSESQNLVSTASFSNGILSGTWEIRDNELVTTYDGNTTTARIVSISTNQIQLAYDLVDIESNNESYVGTAYVTLTNTNL